MDPVQNRSQPTSEIYRHLEVKGVPGSAQRVGFFNIGSGRVLEKIAGSGSGSGWVGVSKYTIGYFRVSFFSQVFPGILGMSGISGFTHI